MIKADLNLEILRLELDSLKSRDTDRSIPGGHVIMRSHDLNHMIITWNHVIDVKLIRESDRVKYQ